MSERASVSVCESSGQRDASVCLCESVCVRFSVRVCV